MFYFLLSLILLLLVAYLLLNTKPVQQWLQQRATQVLSEELQTRVSVGDASFGLFNQMVLHNVAIDDQTGNPLLVADELSARFSVWPFLRRNFVFQHIKIAGMTLSLNNDVEKGNNFDFIIRALRSDSKVKKDFRLRLRYVQLVNCRVSYTSNRKPPVEDRFDANNIAISNLNARVALNYFDRDSLSASLRNISFREHSGLDVRKLAAEVRAGTSELTIANFTLALPQTSVSIPSFRSEYGDMDRLQHLTDSVGFNLELAKSTVCLADLKAFVPELGKIEEKIRVEGVFSGTVSNLSCSTFRASYGSNTLLEGDFRLSGLPNFKQTYLTAHIADFYCSKQDVERFISHLNGTSTRLPQAFKAVEALRFNGNLNGYLLSDLRAEGNIHTNLGIVAVNMSFKKKHNKENSYTYNGALITKQFQLGSLFGNRNIGGISFDIHLDGEKDAHQPPAFNVQGVVSDIEYNAYAFNNIMLNGHYVDKKFNGEIALDDEHGHISLNGLLDFSTDLPHYKFIANVKELQPGKMNLDVNYPDMNYSFNLKIDADGNRLDNFEGSLSLDSLIIHDSENTLSVQRFDLTSRISPEESSIDLNSDFINGYIKGRYTLSTLVASVRYVASQYLPALSNAAAAPFDSQTTDNNFDFDITVSNIDSISRLMKVDWRTYSDVKLWGYYDDNTRKFKVNGSLPSLDNNKIVFSDISVVCENPGDDVELGLDFNLGRIDRDGFATVSFDASAQRDTLLTTLQWNLGQSFMGDVYARTAFSRNEENQLLMTTDIIPTKVFFNDLAWRLDASTIVVEPQKISIDHFYFGSENEGLSINGVLSKNEEDKVELKLQNLDFSYLNQLIRSPEIVSFGGLATGGLTINRALENPIIQADVGIKGFTFNKSTWGDLLLTSVWEQELSRLRTGISVVDSAHKVIDVTGYVYPTRTVEVDWLIKANDLSIAFLQPFLMAVMQDIKGTASLDNLRMRGPINRPLFEGSVFVKDASFGIDFLKTNFFFSDSIRISPTAFTFSNMTLYDSEKNSGTVNGVVQHDSYRNLTFDVRANFTNMLCLNTQKNDFESFYGKAYGTGNVRIRGNRQEINFDISARTEPNTRITIPFSNNLTATEYSFITFLNTPRAMGVTPPTITATDTVRRVRPWFQRPPAEPTKANIKVNLQVEATPDAEILLIIDPVAGDKLRATGTGNLRVLYDDLGDLQLYGSYRLSSGTYDFAFQDLLTRHFVIREGSSITWSGSPYNANIDIDAYYPLTRVSLYDILDEAAMNDPNIRSTTVPVNCLLKLTGELTHPNIKFDIELPGSGDELNNMVRRAIVSEEMMNREIIYLLTIGRFYRTDASSAATQDVTGSDLSYLVSSTLSAQLNNWLSQINDNVSMGINYYNSSDGINRGNEINVNVGIKMLHERLIISGNVGYRDDILANNDFIGDFDVEYKLNRTGKLRAKAYSHSNDKYYATNRGSTIQGAGIIYREEFDTFRELRREYCGNLFGRRKKKKQEKAAKNQREKEEAEIQENLPD